jgi:hypothetical protein
MAGFSPEHDDYQALVYRIAAQVAGTFADAETRLLAAIARRLIRDLPEIPDLADRLAIVRELEGIAQSLTEGITRDMAGDIVARAAREGAASVVQLPTLPPLAGVSTQQALAAALVAYDLGNAFEDMRARILRYPRDAMGEYVTGGDVYQQVIANHVGQVPLGAPKELARKAALQEFLERGVTGFTDIAGRNWRIGTYAEMATRTAVSRAYDDAKVYRAAQVGIDLFTVLGGNNACDHCAPWFGKIIATSGPTGPREVPHSFEDRTITVDVAGTLADWRASGAKHPNCTCLAVEYLPGFSIPVSTPAYDPAAHAARDRLRELEVRERDAKRKLEIATAAGDTAKATRQQKRILTLQAETRAHVAATGQRRRYNRAQVRFADGRRDPGAAPVERVLPRVSPPGRVAPHVPEGLPLERHEIETANRLADVGLRVRFREIDNRPGVKNIDTTIDSMLWELKSPRGTGASTISNQLRRAKEQGATRVVIDNSRTSLDDAAVLAELRRRFARADWWQALIHIARDGTVTRLTRD